MTLTTGDLGAYFSGSSFSVTGTFNQDVTDFTGGDVTITNGSISNFISVSNTVYTWDVSPPVQ